MANSSNNETQLIETTPPEATEATVDDATLTELVNWETFPWGKFTGWVRSQRIGRTTSWVWQFGYEIQSADNKSNKKWVCALCTNLRKGKPATFAALGTQNIEKHLQQEHKQNDPTGKRLANMKRPLKRPNSDSIMKYYGINACNSRDQQIHSSIVGQFDKERFQALVLNWIIESNSSFRTVEQESLRDVFEYLNPCVVETNAHMVHDTARLKLVKLFQQYQATVIQLLKEAPSRIHISFDGWRSNNRHALYGVVCHYLDQSYRPAKLVLGLPEIKVRHSGENIAAEIAQILMEYGIDDKIGYFALDNARNMDSAMDQLGEEFGFDGRSRRARCLGHIINLVCKALLFGHDAEAIEEVLAGDSGVDDKVHEHWRKKGPIGKLHNLIYWIHRSDVLTYSLRNRQEKEFAASDDPQIRAQKPRDVVTDNITRWMSQLHMMRRAIALRPYIEEVVGEQELEWQRGRRNGRTNIQDMPNCLREDSQLTANDWKVIELFVDVLQDFEDILLRLEGDGQLRLRKKGRIDSYGNIWEVLPAYEFLLAQLEKWKKTAERYPDPEHFKININLAWKKLEEYYMKLDDTPLYYAAVVLHPQMKWEWFEWYWRHRPDWIQTARQKVQELWENEYKNRPIPENGPVLKRRKVYHSGFNRFRMPPPSSSSPALSPASEVIDEYVRWIATEEAWAVDERDPGSEDDQEKPEVFIDPFEYWHSKRLQFPHLAQMAIDILSVPCMSAECERLFSTAGLMVSDLRSRLHASTIGLAQTVRSWYRQGIIKAEVPLVIVGKDQQESVIQYTEDRVSSRQQKDDGVDGVGGDMYSSE